MLVCDLALIGIGGDISEILVPQDSIPVRWISFLDMGVSLPYETKIHRQIVERGWSHIAYTRNNIYITKQTDRRAILFLYV
jgi:hypothetical protein